MLAEPLLDALTKTIGRAFAVEASRTTCAWFRLHTPACASADGGHRLTGLFTALVGQATRYGGWDLAGQGLVTLALALADVQPPLGKMTWKVRAMHRLAADILATVRQQCRLYLEITID